MEAKIKAAVETWHEMRERGKVERMAYMEKVFAKWKTYREGVATRRQAIHNKIDTRDDRIHANWAKLGPYLKKRLTC